MARARARAHVVLGVLVSAAEQERPRAVAVTALRRHVERAPPVLVLRLAVRPRGEEGAEAAEAPVHGGAVEPREEGALGEVMRGAAGGVRLWGAGRGARETSFGRALLQA